MSNLTASSHEPAAAGHSNRRRYPRVKGPFDGTWAGAAGNGSARVWDLSVGGCYIDALNDQRQGERITVQISVAEGQISAEGDVVYSVANQGFAVQFIDMPGESREVLYQAMVRMLAEGLGT
jgi:hypothetical protein